MTMNAEMARVGSGPFQEDSAAGGSSAATVPQSSDSPQQADMLYAERMRQLARHEIVLDSIRAHLQEQPSSRTVRACARRWASDIIRLADEVISARQKGER
jgi:hypothetical protein